MDHNKYTFQNIYALEYSSMHYTQDYNRPNEDSITFLVITTTFNNSQVFYSKVCCICEKQNKYANTVINTVLNYWHMPPDLPWLENQMQHSSELDSAVHIWQ